MTTEQELNYQIFDHPSDLGVAVKAENVTQLFENAAKVLFHLMTDLNKIKPNITREIKVQAPDKELLFRDWLGELLAIFHTDEYVFNSFNIKKLTENKLAASISGDKYNEKQHRIKREIKAVTYHELRIKCDQKGCQARFILDI